MDSDATVGPAPVAGPLRLAPFHGLTLSPERVGDPASARLFARPYRNVPTRLKQWERRRFLVRDAEPAVYLHEYTTDGITIRGLVGALEVSARAHDRAPVVWPHEGIHPAQAEELATRMTTMSLNPAPILLVHRGSPAVRQLLHEVTASAPDHDFTDRAGRLNRLWAIRPGPRLDALEAGLADAQAMIADGHHRYAAYLRMQEAGPGSSADAGLAMLVDQTDTPLFLGPIHRRLGSVPLADVEAAADGWARVRRLPRGPALDALGPGTLVATDGEHWTALEVDVPPDRALVELLHEQLLPRLALAPGAVEYHHTVEDALARLRRRGTALLLPAPDVDLVLRIVASGRLLPEKATSFQPKPSLGVLMRSLLD